MTDDILKKNSFEENLKKFEKIVDSLEEGELSLEDTIKKYEEGIELSKLCTKELNSAQKKIEKILEEDGKIKSELFEVD